VAPRAQVVGSALVAEDLSKALEGLGHGPDLRQVAARGKKPSVAAIRPPRIPGKRAGSSLRARDGSRCRWSYPPCSVGLGEAYYPGWTAQVGEEELPCLPANA